MKKALLLCALAAFAPAHSMQWLRTGIANANRYANRQTFSTNCQAITNLLPFMRAKKVNALQNPALKTNYKQSYDEQYSYSNNNSDNNNSNHNWSSNFKWGKVSPLIPTLSAGSWFSKIEDERKALIDAAIKEREARDVKLAKTLLRVNLVEESWDYLFELLSYPNILEKVLIDADSGNKLTLLLAHRNIEMPIEIALTAKLVNLYPVQAYLLFKKLDPQKMDDRFPEFLIRALSTMDRRTSIRFIKFVVKGIKASTANQALWEYKIANLISLDTFDPRSGSEILNNIQLQAYADIIAFLQCNASYSLRRTAPDGPSAILQMFSYHALQKNEDLWQLSPSAQAFDIIKAYHVIIRMLREEPQKFDISFVPFFADAPQEVQAALQVALEAQKNK